MDNHLLRVTKTDMNRNKDLQQYSMFQLYYGGWMVLACVLIATSLYNFNLPDVSLSVIFMMMGWHMERRELGYYLNRNYVPFELTPKPY